MPCESHTMNTDASFDLTRLLPYTLLAGGTAALLDGLLACVYWGVARGTTPMEIFQSVSAGLLGRAAFDGGPPTAWLGVALHLFIACMMALAYGLLARQWPGLLRLPWWAAGPAYGLLLYAVMHLVVLPLSRALPPPTMWTWRVADVGSHVVFVGLSIAWYARRLLPLR
jgi:uncharacterized membrane protein YagU involved in acid resistance